MDTTRFVGRSDEHRGLVSRLGESGTVTLILGEAGVGKTRLINEATSALAHPSFIGQAWTGAAATPYLPWMQIAAAARTRLDPTDMQFGTRFADVLSMFSTGKARPRFEGDDSVRHLIALGLADYLRELSDACGGLVTLVIEDAHSADVHSIELVRRIASQQLPVSIVVTSRPFAEAEQSVEPELTAFAADSDMLALRPLGRVGVGELLRDGGLTEDRVEEAMAASGGVPLLVHSWIAERALAVPNTGRPGIDHRLAAAGADAIDVLRYGALIGDEFDTTTLSKATGLGTVECAAVLEGAQRLGLIDAQEGVTATYRFHHETFREAIESQMALIERAQRHAKLLDVFLDARGTAAERNVSQLAEHAARSAFVGDAPLAVELNMAAAQDALDRAAPKVAHNHYQRAIELAELAGSPRALRFEAELGSLRALKATGHAEARSGTIRLLNRLTDEPELTDVFVEAVLLLPTSSSAMGVAPDVQPAVKAWVRRALERIGPEVSERRVRLLVELALQSRDEDRERFDAIFAEAAGLADDIGDPHLRVIAYTGHQWISRQPGDTAEILEQIASLEREIRPDDHDCRFWLSGLKVTTLIRIGDTTSALRELSRMEHELAPLPPLVAWLLGRFKALLEFMRGELEKAEASALAAYECVSGGHHDAVALEYLQMQLALVLRLQVTPELVEPIVGEMVAARPNFLGYRAAYAWILSDLGRPDEGRAHLAHVFASDLTDRGAIEWLPTVCLATNAAVALDEPDWCRIGMALLEPYRDEWTLYGTSTITEGPVSLRRGRAAIVAGDLDQARADLRHARTELARANAMVFEPELFHHEALLAEAEGDIEAAEIAMTSASLAASNIGMERLASMLAAHAFDLADQYRESTESAAAPMAQASAAAFVHEGATWVVGLGEERASVGHVKGMIAIAELLDNPAREFTAQQLAALIDGTSRGAARGGDAGYQGGPGSSEAALLDETAIQQYRQRILDLEHEVEEAAEFNDPGRESKAQEELDALIDHLAKSTGLAGRSRETTSTAERARVRITKSIRTAIGRISEVTPALGRHLENSISTGAYCSYRPDAVTQIDWTREQAKPGARPGPVLSPLLFPDP